MRVSTDLKAGALISEAADAAAQLGSQVSDFISAAQEQAQDVTGRAGDLFSGFWQGLTGLFS
ncbi:MAG: hypothetical protein QME21_09640 [Anaerolineales bacterium]|jgi:uncharacterized protein (DUF1778 family)|nr:hypothetical protein [Anaerolineales bacterium]